ncbi:hypothetical protein NQD34_000361 [Periophthalmus magnuspinnatus]|nr:hypothetical protein NQD34_000361 [Periophthalmus magnuspinnatus]
MTDFGALPTNGVGGGMKKDAFADALQRARQIAAKIGGEVPVSNNGGAEGYPFSTQKRSLEDGGHPHNFRICSIRSSTMTDELKVPDSMVGLIIGRGGEQINKIQLESGCKVQIAHDSAGLPERSVSLTGSPESIQRARALIDEIVSKSNDNGNSNVLEMMIPAGKGGIIIGKGGETIKQLQARAGVKMYVVQDSSQSPNVDKVLRIIGDHYKVQQAKEMVNDILREGFADRNEYGSRMGGGGMEIAVPRHSVGVVIGRNGEMIKKIQSDAGVKIQFKPDDGSGPDKIAHIMGPPDQCQHAASIITDLLQSVRAREEGGQGGPPGMPPGGRGRGQGNWGPPGGGMTFSIPAHKCGLVIGRGGETVKSINQQTGAFVEISREPPPNGDPNFKLFTIRGSPQQIDHAKQLIEKKIEGPLCPVGGGPGPGGPMGPYNPNPYNAGPPGGAPHGAQPGGQFCPQGWGNAYQQWQGQGPHDPSKAAADHSAAWAAYYAQYYGQQPGGAMPGQPGSSSGAPGDGPQPSQSAGGQPDYTKAWEEYYKKMGMRSPAGTGGAAAAAQPGGQQDYSAAWAEYYRQQAAYYGQTGQTPGQAPTSQPGQV